MVKSEIKERLIEQIKEKHPSIEKEQIAQMNLYELNIDSLSIMRILSYWMKEGYKVNFAQFMKEPYVDKWVAVIAKAPRDTKAASNTNEVSDKEPFSLTDVQYAYWIGRRESQYLGGVGCHGYMEVRCRDIDGSKLREAWAVVQNSHRMLRAKYTDDGKQYIMDTPYSRNVRIENITNLSDEEQSKHLLKKREQLSHRLLNIDEGQVAELQLTQLNEHEYILHFDIDLLICDVLSFKIILRDLARYYKDNIKPTVADWNFAQYLQDTAVENKQRRIEDEQYWMDKIAHMPDGPKLPLRHGVDSMKYPKFKRRSVYFNQADWRTIKKAASDYELTPAMILLTAYARTVARWSENKKFLMSLPLFNRDATKEIEDVVADFTNLVLVEMDFSKERSFIEDAKNIQKSFLDNIAHTNVSGIWVMRQVQKKKGNDIKAPVVFSCNLGEPLLTEEFVESFGNIHYMISQTPQVWIDFQAFDEDHGLTLLWDSIDEIFPSGMLEEMFEFFKKEVSNVVDYGLENRVINESIGEIRRKKVMIDHKNDQAHSQTLYEKIFEQSKKNPDKIAIKNVDTNTSISYGQLCENALAIAAALAEQKDAKANNLVAIFMPRGEKQIISAMGVLSSAMGYVPIHVGQAKERVLEMISEENISFVITQDSYREIIAESSTTILNYDSLIAHEPLAAPVATSGQTSAYVIFTSGTTGKPKGVEISHESAVNTIDSVNELCGVTAQDCILNVSSYDFDLSVYDFWGILREGGKLCVLTQNSWRDVSRWLEVLKSEKITLWNSVPTLLKMLFIEMESTKQYSSSLRWVMLSGDWIDLDIPKRMADLAPEARMLAMGGATEASIWSNYSIVQNEVPEDWVSIPYGKALPKQSYRVVSAKGKDCPSYVPGELWIGGVGVAKGYLGDTDLTAKKFIEDSYGRWYRTGDMGRFWNDDTIEFLGRKDGQVKVRGHRIELGEIEYAIDKLVCVNKSYVDIMEGQQTKALIAYIFLNEELDNEYSISQKSCLDTKKINANFEIALSDDIAKQIQAQREEYDQYCAGKLHELLPGINLDSVQSEYKPFVEQWEKLRNSFQGNTTTNEHLDAFFSPFEQNFADLLAGVVTAKDIITAQDFIGVEEILKTDVQANLLENILIDRLKELSTNNTEQLSILILDAHSPKIIENVSAICGAGNCTVAVSSEYYIEKLKAQINEEIKIIKLDASYPLLKLQKGYDVVLANQSLHRTENVNIALANVQKLLKENGRLLCIESNYMTSLALLSTVFLKREYTDRRSGCGTMLLSHDEWEEVIFSSNFTQAINFNDENRFGGFSYFELINGHQHYEGIDHNWIKEAITNRIPEYMVPKHYVFINEIPMTANGKVDRARLKRLNPVEEGEQAEEERVYSQTEKKLKEIWDKLLKTSAKVSDNYFVLGGDSLLATVLRNEIKKNFTIEYSLEDIFLHPTLCTMAAKIDETVAEHGSQIKDLVALRDDKPYQPFPLTQIQQSYLIGRSDAFDLSNCSSHCYFEMTTEWLDEQKLQSSLNEIIKIHPMMRAVICSDNLNQKILEKTPEYLIKTENLSNSSEEKAENRIAQIREELSYQIFDPYKWPAYDFRYVQLGENKGRLFISFDNIFFDGWSMFYIFRQWKQLYDNPEMSIEKSDFTFKEYVLSTNAYLSSDTYQHDLEYWKDKINTINPAPELPVNKEQGSGVFTRYTTGFSADKWEKVKSIIKSLGLTEPVFLMSLYAEVIAKYSRHQKFSLNLTRFNRLPFVEDINLVVGDFTTLTILSLDLTKGSSFVDRAKDLQKVLWSDLSHSTVSGIEVERMMNQNRESEITMPVVFTSGLGLTADRTIEDHSYLGTICYGLSQTPQVWLDMQVYDDATGLSVSLDAVESLFPENIVAQMFDNFTQTLNALICDDSLWTRTSRNIIKANNTELVKSINDTDKQFKTRTLIDGLLEHAKLNPDKTAIVFENKKYSYGHVYDWAKNFACTLIEIGVTKEQPVAIYMQKGVHQIIAALAIMMAGGCYVPLNKNHPIARNKRIMERAGVTIMFVDSDEQYQEFEEDYVLVHSSSLPQKQTKLPKINPDELAYIIYTSGTTGEPKGVAITHAGAMNTIIDVNKRLSVSHEDATIALSQMNFDLSVYDIFGMFEAGGTVVVPEASSAIEPVYWVQLIEKENVTIWNSVPAYMQMFIEYLQNNDQQVFAIKHILLSGDWIPVDIKLKVDASVPKATVYALGGATEASIWSNWHQVVDADKDRASIPYGVPLANQKMYILNDQMEVVPNHVAGDLYIAGLGLARCYWNDQERTRVSFIENAFEGMRLYRTGDLAMYSDEGYIVFLGREDDQIKLGGYRIEIGEIESAIRKLTNCTNAVVFKDNQLYAFISTQDDRVDIKEGLKDLIPSYMIPKHIYRIEQFPLSANGKIDRKRLVRDFSSNDTDENRELAASLIEKNLADIWKTCLQIEEVYRQDNFFQKGGDSLKAVTIVNEIKKTFHVEISLGSIFEYPTIKALAEMLELKMEGSEEGEI